MIDKILDLVLKSHNIVPYTGNILLYLIKEDLTYQISSKKLPLLHIKNCYACYKI